MSKQAILKQIAQKIKPGDISYYIERNNKFNALTITDEKHEIEQILKDSKNWGELINAVYDNDSSHSKMAAPKKGSRDTFVVVDTKNKNQPSFEVQVKMERGTLILTNLANKNQKTLFEFAESLEEMVDTATTKKHVDVLKTELEAFKNKPSKELWAFLKNVVNTRGLQ